MRLTHDNLIYLPPGPGCEYGALRTAPPLPYTSLQELPDMAETSIIVATSGPAHGGPPHQGPTSLSPGPVHHLAHAGHPHSLALTHSSLQHLNSSASTNGQHLSNSSSLNSSVSSNGGGGGTLVVQPDGTTTATTTATSTILTVRMIMQGKEVGSIIGKKGDNIKKFREESGAKINISDGSCPERIVTVTGSTENIQRAFGFICKKFEEFNSPCLPQQQDLQTTPTTPKPPVTLRLVVPASQCGSLIGKQGCKIKEIREATGASIQVASEMLPNSTERAVTVSGTADAITECIKYVCGIMLESPPKGANLPYRPKPLLSPLYIPGNQAFTVPASVASLSGQELSKGYPAAAVPMAHAIPMLPSAQNIVPGSLVPINGLGPGALPSLGPPLGTALGPALWPGPLPPPPHPHHQPQPPQPPQCLSLGPSLQYTHRAGAPPGPHHQQALPAPPGPQAQEMNIPNDLIGCIIGRGGQKINEIRQVSGATIKISNAEDGSSDRKVTITGPPECIGLAQYLISTRLVQQSCFICPIQYR